jgi:protocatechuate 3,4-dioxygenase beta subunit
MSHTRRCVIATIAVALAAVPVEARQAASAADCPLPSEGSATAIVRGRVLDEKTGVPLRGAPVELRWLEGADMKTQRQRAETGAGGVFTFCAAPAAQQLFVNAKYGSAERTTTGFQAAPGGETTVDVRLDAAHMTLTGQVVEFETGAPIASATVRLSGTPLQAFTQADGRFVIQQLPPGPYDVDVEHVSYRTVRDSFDLDLGTNVSLTVRMAASAIPLEPLIVTVRSQHLERTGFYDRRERGHGTYITRDEIERTLPSYSTDILLPP